MKCSGAMVLGGGILFAVFVTDYGSAVWHDLTQTQHGDRMTLQSSLAAEFQRLRNEIEQAESQGRSGVRLVKKMQQGSIRGHLFDDPVHSHSLSPWYLRHKSQLPVYSQPPPRGGMMSNVYVTMNDSLEVALELIAEGLNPAVLNMANQFHAGGGLEGGALAQEEEICRKSTLIYSLSPTENPRLSLAGEGRKGKGKHRGGRNGIDYRIRDLGYIYSPFVEIMKTRTLPRKGSFKYDAPVPLPTPYPHVGVISVAMIDLRRGVPQDYMRTARGKVKMTVLAALKHGHDSIVLGAIGCGVFGNDPKVVAELYKETLNMYGKHFKKIVFAILVASDRDQKNLDTFESVLGKGKGLAAVVQPATQTVGGISKRGRDVISELEGLAAEHDSQSKRLRRARDEIQAVLAGA